jgi:TonB family protein
MSRVGAGLVIATLAWDACGSVAGGQSDTLVQEIADYDRRIEHNRAVIRMKEAKRTDLDRDMASTQAALAEVEQRMAPLAASLETLATENEKGKGLLEAALAYPEIADTAKLDVFRKHYHSMRARLERVVGEKGRVSAEMETWQRRLAGLRQQRQALDDELEGLQFGTRVLLINRPVVVVASGECVMHEDITIRACKELALSNAKQEAVEKGGMSLVRSVTEVSQHNLTRDDLTVENAGEIRELQVTSPFTYASGGGYGKWVVTIRAIIQSHPPLEKENSGRLVLSRQSIDLSSQAEKPALQLKPSCVLSQFSLCYFDSLLKMTGIPPHADSYLMRAKQHIESFWVPPAVDVMGQESTVVIAFRAHRNGRISGVTIEQSSGILPYDVAGMRTILQSSPLPAFPPEITESVVDGHFVFTIGQSQ